MAGKTRLEPELTDGRNRCFSGRVVDPGVFNKTIIVLGLAGP